MEPASYGTPYTESVECVPGTGIFRFAKPEGHSFTPGQFMSVTLDTRDGAQTKHFTYSQAPADPYLEMTTRLSGSAFKDALLALRPGDEVGVRGPSGRMVLPHGAKRAAFLAGGVGITPARSIIRDAVQRSTGLQIALFYGNEDQDSIAFGGELASYAAEHSEIAVVDVLLAPGPGWIGETGFITAEVVRRHVDPLNGWHWMVAGPPAMVAAMERVVDQLGIPAANVSFERFSGYD
jgi:ferredoxin-NADP reductase